MRIKWLLLLISIILLSTGSVTYSVSAIENSLYLSNLWEEHEEQNRHTSYFAKYRHTGERNWTLEPNVSNWSTKWAGIYEVTRYPESNPNLKDLEEAWNLYNRVYDVVEERNWKNFSKAQSDNFDFQSDQIHYGNRQYIFDNETLNPEKPEYLIYYNISGEVKLAGIMFLANDIRDKPPADVGGPLTLWHYHRYDEIECFENNVLAWRDDECRGKKSYRSPEMLHVWLIEHPENQFASMMGVPRRYVDYDSLSKLTKTEFLDQELSGESWFAYGK